MKKLKEEQKWHQEKPQRVIIDTKFREYPLTYSNAWFIVPFIIFLGTLFLTFTLYGDMPQKLPMKYDFSGNVTNWADKSIKSVLILPAMQLFLIGMFLFANMIIARAKQQIQAGNPEKSIQQNIISRRRWSMYTIFLGTATVLLFLFIQLSYTSYIGPTQLNIFVMIFTFLIVVGSVVLAILTGQGGRRIKIDSSKGEEHTINHDEDQYWKLGQIYINPSDPAMFVEKRFGIGWTVNLGRPLAWIILLIIILTAVGLPIFLSN